jgi:hypothetical protein
MKYVCFIFVGTFAWTVAVEDCVGLPESCDLQGDEIAFLQQPSQGDGRVLLKKSQLDSIEQLEAWSKREFALVAEPKGGFEMFAQAASSMRSGLIKLSVTQNLPLPNVTFRGTDISHSVSLKQVGQLTNILGNEPSCFGHVTRNPFEMVVSGYVYLMGNSETWMNLTLGMAREFFLDDACDPMLVDCKTADKSKCKALKDFEWSFPNGHWRSLAQIHRCATSGNVSSLLPTPLTTETYPEYLVRVDLDAGLIAQTVFASDEDLSATRFNYDLAKKSSCSADACFTDFYDDCSKQWEQILDAWNTPETYRSVMLASASKSCPLINPQTEKHKGANIKTISHPPEHVMVKRLRELDRLYFNGVLHDLEAHLACRLGGEYAPPAAAAGSTPPM